MEQLLAWLLEGVLGILMGIVWYRDREKDRKIEKLETRLNETREQYVHKDDLKELKSELNHRFDKLEDMLQKRIN